MSGILAEIGVFPFGWKVGKLQKELNRESLPEAESKGLIYQDILQQPAVIQLRSDELVFTPVLGTSFALSRSEITEFKESTWLNGSFFPGRTGFRLKTSTVAWRIGFAVFGDPQPWRDFLNGTVTAETSSDSGVAEARS